MVPDFNPSSFGHSWLEGKRCELLWKIVVRFLKNEIYTRVGEMAQQVRELVVKSDDLALMPT